MASKSPSSTQLQMAQIMEPQHANFLGKVFGGTILSMIDLCAYTTASRFAGSLCVTASIDRVDFHEPIEVGELVTMIGVVSFVGRTSVYAEDIYKQTNRHTNTARVTTVALGQDSKPVEVPRLVCESREDKIRFLEGKLRRELRTRQREERERLAANFQQADDGELDRLMALGSLLG
jgi:uncharacterized protein (TIGR00369 family)